VSGTDLGAPGRAPDPRAPPVVSDARSPAAFGTSPAALARHYDLPAAFFELWLGPELVYSCARWDPDDDEDTLERAQWRKIDHFATAVEVRGGRVLDVGCGWGGTADRLCAVHGAATVVGLTPSPAQAAMAASRVGPGVTIREQSWSDHQPDAPYDAIVCIEASEHFARDGLGVEEKVAAYRAFFTRCASWLRPGGRLGLQAICLDNAGHRESLSGDGAINALIRAEIFPESMSSSLSELVLGWETDFRLVSFAAEPDHYVRTFQAWSSALRAAADRAEELVGPGVQRRFARYFAAGRALFRLRQQTLYRIVLSRRPEPKRWVAPPAPSPADPPPAAETAIEPVTAPRSGTSAPAIRAHYDLSNEFYALWLGPSMSYSSGRWTEGTPDDGAAQAEKVAFFAARLGVAAGRLLDVGCGWAAQLRPMVEQHGVAEGVGLTLSDAQAAWVSERPVARTEVRLESWVDHDPAQRYDAIMSFGAFEHFARDGTTGDARVCAYRAFFARCFGWLPEGGRLGLETIAHDDAPDTDTPLGRGPLGDFVLGLYPESLSPHLCEIVLGFEPYFLVRELRADGRDFGRTIHAWLETLVAHRAEAEALVGVDTYRRFKTYLAASEVQFRLRAITNYRLVLERRPAQRR
jgi:cyclopropane-fatty-acyl-phospholipid synthase